MFVSIQAKILAISALVTLVISFVLSLMTNGIFAIISFVFGILVMLIAVLDQDCVVVGGCNIWAWVKLAIGLLALIIPVGITMYNISTGVDVKKEDTTTTELDVRNMKMFGFMP